MRQEIILNSSIAQLNNACDQCEFVISKESCAFGNSALKTNQLHAETGIQGNAIIYLWDKYDTSANCQNPQKIQELIDSIRKALKM